MSEAQTVTLSYEDGSRTVELARESVEAYVQNGKREQPGSMRDAFYARTGAFVRLQSTRGRGSLRGCAGGYRGDEQLGHAIVDAAIEAASEDSCGSEVQATELDSITVSVCTVTDVTLTDRPAEDLQLGRHGVAVDTGSERGWLYPTVPVENGWSAEEYLSRACRTAKISPEAWRQEDVMVTLFEGDVFREREPTGSVQRLDV
jgi:uncharacterized protein (TIGR00296 family)